MTAPAPGPRADLRRLLPPVRDQGQRGTCVAFAVTAAHEAERAGSHGAVEDLSEEALFWGCKVVDGNWSSGTRFASAATALSTTGQPLASTWPYDADRAVGVAYAPPTLPDESWFTANLRALAVDLDAIRAELYGGRPVILGIVVLDRFFFPGADGRIDAPDVSAKARGRHAVLAAGYDAGAVLVRNSWSSDWGLDGYGWLSNDYVKAHVREVWAIGPGPAGSSSEVTTGDTYGAQ